MCPREDIWWQPQLDQRGQKKYSLECHYTYIQHCVVYTVQYGQQCESQVASPFSYMYKIHAPITRENGWKLFKNNPAVVCGDQYKKTWHLKQNLIYFSLNSCLFLNNTRFWVQKMCHENFRKVSIANHLCHCTRKKISCHCAGLPNQIPTCHCAGHSNEFSTCHCARISN